jgi:hypothetical protein
VVRDFRALAALSPASRSLVEIHRDWSGDSPAGNAALL